MLIRRIILAALSAGILIVLAINLPKINGTEAGTEVVQAEPTQQTSTIQASYAFEENLPPTHLVIPSLDLNAAIQAVGVTADGSMDVAHSYSEVGWYKYGPIPGAPGDAVIEGHLDTKISPYAVFYNLNKLRPGDDVQIIDAAGRTADFVVTGSKSYPYNTTTTEIFGTSAGQDAGESYLNLVTCTGAWIKSKKIYDERLVVFTKRIE